MTYQNSANNRDINQPVNAQSGTIYVAALSDTIIAMSNVAARQVTLPAPSASGITSTVGKVYTIKDVAGTGATANITITPASGTIDGASSIALAMDYGSIAVYSDGVAWYSQAANYAAGVTLATASFNRFASGTTPYTPGTTVLQTSVAGWDTLGNSASRLDLSSLTQNSLVNFTITGSGTTIQFSQAGTYQIILSDVIGQSVGLGTLPTAQLVKNGSTILALSQCYLTGSGAAIPAECISFNYIGTFASTDTIDVRYVVTGSGTYNWRANNFLVTQLPSIAGNTPTNNIITVTSGMSPYTYNPSANLQYAIVEVVGGGGGGGATTTTGGFQSSTAGGGGGGGYARATLSATQIGTSQTVNIGSGGTAGAVAGGSGGTGGTTSLGALLSATGGSGGSGCGIGNASIVGGGAGGTGSLGGGVSGFTVTGSDGGWGIGIATNSPGAAQIALGGAGGSSVLAGVRSNTNNAAGFNGYLYGGGASGASTTGSQSQKAGGVGAAGVCIITEYIFAPPPLTTTASITWNTVSGTSQAMSASNGYYTTNGSATTLSLPTSGAAAGTVIEVVGTGAGLWTITQSSGQSIRFGNQTTTTGAGGSLAEQAVGDSISLVCITANTTWVAFASHGNLTVV